MPKPSQWKVVSALNLAAQSVPSGSGAWRAFAWLCGCSALPLAVAHAQSSPPDSDDAPAPAGPLATVHGVVKNAATGEPLPRVLVSIESEYGKGVLTDGDGRFEIPGVPAGGTVPIDLTKPGFEDISGHGDESAIGMNIHGMPHAVTITADMPDLEFSMRPLDAIRGQIELSTGEPAEGFRLELFKQSVSEGRLQWQVVGSAASNADGAFRFGGLADGVLYAGHRALHRRRQRRSLQSGRQSDPSPHRLPTRVLSRCAQPFRRCPDPRCRGGDRAGQFRAQAGAISPCAGSRIREPGLEPLTAAPSRHILTVISVNGTGVTVGHERSQS